MGKILPNFNYEYHCEDSLCKITGSGNLNFEMITKAVNHVANHPNFKSDCCLIVDLRKMNYHPSYNEFLGIVDTLKLLNDKFANKIALITATEMHI